MPFSFDFRNAGANVFASGTDLMFDNVADGVRFTVSGDVAGGAEYVTFGNAGDPAIPLTFSDLGADDALTLGFESVANPVNTRISGDVAAPILLQWQVVNGTWTVGFRTSGGGTTHPTGPTYQITNNEDNQHLTFQHPAVTGIVFTSSNGAGAAKLVLTGLSGNAFNCFCADTRISTPDGPVLVEMLQPGDTILAADGREITVRWLGRQRVDTRFCDPARANPVCVGAGALGPGLPARDLWISPDHAIALDGLLVNAAALINGGSICQVAQMPPGGFTYYHIETDAHELILAEGVAAETFLDRGNLSLFENASERPTNDQRREMELPRVSSPRMLPKSIRDQLDLRAVKAA